jgi:hypothetical protein
MTNPAGESNGEAFRLDFDRRLTLQFRGSVVTSDAGLLAYRELDDALGLSDLAGERLADARTGKNGRHALLGMLRQAVFGRLAGYEDVNDAERLRHDPAMRWIVGGKAAHGCAASPSQMGRFGEGIRYAIRLPANRVLQERIGYLLKRPVGRPSLDVRRSYTNFTYQAGSWTKPRRVVAKVEWHPGELYPRVGFIVTNMARPAENVVAFYNKRGTCEQWIKEGKGAIRWTRLSCRSFAANAVRLQLHALAYNLGNFLRTLATPEPIKDWSLTSLKEKLIKIGAKVVRHGRYVAFQMAEVAVPRHLFVDILRLIAELRPPPVTSTA